MNLISKLFLIVSLNLVLGWNLNKYGIGDNYYVSSAALYMNRLFLAFPRSAGFNNKLYPTVIEVPWTGTLFHHTYLRRKHVKYQNWNNCSHIQNVVALDVEKHYGKLWILDKGNNKCPPKIMCHNLLRNTVEKTIILDYLNGSHLKNLIIDPFYPHQEGRAYMIYESKLIVLSLVHNTRRTLYLKTDNCLIEFIVFSQIGNPRMFLSGKDIEIFSVDIEYLNKTIYLMDTNTTDLYAKKIGDKLGPSAALFCDSYGGLIYYLMQDYAVLRWNISLPMNAESHEVLMQSEKIAHVSHFFEDQHKNVWAIVNPFDEDDCLENNVLNENNGAPFTNRIVKVFPNV